MNLKMKVIMQMKMEMIQMIQIVLIAQNLQIVQKALKMIIYKIFFKVLMDF